MNLTLRLVGFDYRTSTGLGKQTLGGHKQNLVCTRTQEKGAVTPKETKPDLRVSVQESPAEASVEGPAVVSGALNPTDLGVLVCWHTSFRRGSPLLPLPLP